MKPVVCGVGILNIGDAVTFIKKLRLLDGKIIPKGTMGIIVNRNDPSGIYIYQVETVEYGIIVAREWNIELI